jgi:hypothetical protein
MSGRLKDKVAVVLGAGSADDSGLGEVKKQGQK